MSVEETEWCWLNGQIIPLREARVSVEDRGFQFADSVYEALRIYNGQPFAMQKHLDRLENSCRGLNLSLPIDRETLASEMLKLVKHSELRDNAILYLQLTRGHAQRNHVFPAQPQPTLLFFVRKISPITPIDQQRGAKLITVQDERWDKCWIKTTALMANVIARNAAEDTGADEALFIYEKDMVAECTSSNLFAVIDGVLVTHPVGPRVLPGVTRDVAIECAKSAGIEVQERPISLPELQRADEAFITSTSRQVVWVKLLDDATIGNGSCGKLTRRVSQLLDVAIQKDHMRGS